MKNNYESVPQILDLLVSSHAICISVHVQYQCFHYTVTWENDHQRSKKSPLNEIVVQMASVHLFLIILIVFIMICIMKDAQWHLAQNLSFRYVTGKNWWPKNHTRSEVTGTAFAVKHNPQGTNKSHQEYSQKTIYTELQGGC